MDEVSRLLWKPNRCCSVPYRKYECFRSDDACFAGRQLSFLLICPTVYGRLFHSWGKLIHSTTFPLPVQMDSKKEKPIRETYYRGNERIDEVTPKYALLSTHTGRRTFICNALALGIPVQVVMKWTGHSDYKAMKPYIDIADEIKINAMTKFNLI